MIYMGYAIGPNEGPNAPVTCSVCHVPYLLIEQLLRDGLAKKSA